MFLLNGFQNKKRFYLRIFNGILYVFCVVYTYYNTRLWCMQLCCFKQWFLISVVIMQCAVIYTNYNKPNNQFVVFHKSRYSLIGSTTHNTIKIATDMDSISSLKTKIVKDYTVGNYISNIKMEPIQSVYLLKNTKVLVVDSLGIYNVKIVSARLCSVTAIAQNKLEPLDWFHKAKVHHCRWQQL